MKVSELINYDKSFDLLEGKPDQLIEGIANVRFPENNCLVFIKNKKFLERLDQALAKCTAPLKVGVVLEKKVVGSILESGIWQKNQKFWGWVAQVDSLALSMCFFSKPFYEKKWGELNFYLDGRIEGSAEIHPTAQIAQNVFIGDGVRIEENVVIHPGCVVMAKSRIKANSVLFPQVSIYPFVEIGENCRLHANCVIGADGFGYQFYQGQHLKIWHMGGVKIGNCVEIGANATIDAGAFCPTLIGDGCILDNTVQIAHNNIIGQGVVFCGHSGTAGSVIVGDYTMVGGKAAIGPDLEVGSGCQIAGAAALTSNLADGSVVGGHPARPLKEWLKGVAWLRKMSLGK